MFGVLNLDKPEGMTSREAVNKVQRLIRPTKVGHAGTLDPIATGVLLVSLGQATRLTEHAHRLPKTYRATFLLGQSSPTDDVEVEAEHHPESPQPTLEEIEKIIPQFQGEIQQRPPAFSAVKVKGQRAYKLARKGKILDLAPRPITIHRLLILNYVYPELILEIECGTGTYVRSLGRDLAKSLGTVCVMSALRRLSIGPFIASEGISPPLLNLQTIQESLQPPLSLLGELETISLSDLELGEIRHGRPIRPREDAKSCDELACLAPQGVLVALACRKSDGLLWPVKTFFNTNQL